MPDPNRIAYLQEKLATASAILDLRCYSNRSGKDGWRSVSNALFPSQTSISQLVSDCIEYLTLIGRLEVDPENRFRIRIKEDEPCPPKCS